jgi:hypothetical protein
MVPGRSFFYQKKSQEPIEELPNRVSITLPVETLECGDEIVPQGFNVLVLGPIFQVEREYVRWWVDRGSLRRIGRVDGRNPLGLLLLPEPLSLTLRPNFFGTGGGRGVQAPFKAPAFGAPTLGAHAFGVPAFRAGSSPGEGDNGYIIGALHAGAGEGGALRRAKWVPMAIATLSFPRAKEVMVRLSRYWRITSGEARATDGGNNWL